MKRLDFGFEGLGEWIFLALVLGWYLVFSFFLIIFFFYDKNIPLVRRPIHVQAEKSEAKVNTRHEEQTH